MIRQNLWSPSRGLKLEPNAERAVRSPSGCVALMAGPGAGKTEALAQRADFLLKTGLCPYPKRVLAISFKKDASENLKSRVLMRCGNELATRFDSYTFHAFAKRIIDIFRPFLKNGDALDEDYTIGDNRISKKQITFDDLIPLGNEIVTGCKLAQRSIQETYSDIFLDEFQDCTKAQYSLLTAAFKGTKSRIIAVGDTKQKIMGWAGAFDGIFADFGKDFSAVPLNLYQNFRSKDRIRRVHNRMVLDIDPPAAVDESEISGQEGIVSLKRFDTDDEEAVWVANAVQQWISEGLPPSEVSILCNTQPHLYAAKIMLELRARSIAFRNEQDVQELFSEPLFGLIVDFLTLLNGSVEPDAWERFQYIANSDIDGDLLDANARFWSQFVQRHQQAFPSLDQFESIWACVLEMLDTLGIERVRLMSHDYNNKQRYDELLSKIETRIADIFNTRDDFSASLKAIGQSDAVRILTIHKCKGLEFHTVIVHAVEKETFWGKTDAAQCAYFVAISRAKSRLVATTSAFRSKPHGANWHWKEPRTEHGQFLSYLVPEIGPE